MKLDWSIHTRVASKSEDVTMYKQANQLNFCGCYRLLVIFLSEGFIKYTTSQVYFRR